MKSNLEVEIAGYRVQILAQAKTIKRLQVLLYEYNILYYFDDAAFFIGVVNRAYFSGASFKARTSQVY